MTHKQFKRLLRLFLYDELNEQERASLEAHMEQCAECRTELHHLKHAVDSIGDRQPAEPTDQLLNKAREQLHLALRSVDQKASMWSSLFRSIKTLAANLQASPDLPRYAVASAGIGIFILGGLLGYTVFSVRSPENPPPQIAATDLDYLKGNGFEITNVQFLNPDTSKGNIEVSFDAVQHLRTKGNIGEEKIKKLLTYTLINESNAGVRLRSLDIIKAHQFAVPDKEVRATLIKVLRSDENAGVRREALAALEKFPFDDTVKGAFLYVLANDPNPGLRISAIDVLVTKVAGQIWDREILRTLKNKMQTDDNKYIRVHAKNLLEDIRQQ